MPERNVKVTKVYDGDTFRVDRKIRGTKVVRIKGIDTPEKGSADMGGLKPTRGGE